MTHLQRIIRPTLNVCLLLVLVQMVEWFGYQNSDGVRLFAPVPFLAAWFIAQNSRGIWAKICIFATFFMMSVIRAYILRAASPAVFFSLVTNLWVFGSTWGLLLITRKLLVGRSASLQQFLEAAAVCLLPAVGVYYFRQLTLPTFVDLHGNDYGISFAFVLGNFAGLSFTSLLTLDPSKYSLTLSKGKSLRNQIALIVTSAAFAVFTTFRLPDPELILAIMQMAVSIALPFELAMTSVLLNINLVGFK